MKFETRQGMNFEFCVYTDLLSLKCGSVVSNITMPNTIELK